MLLIRDILPADRPSWALLWEGYLEFYHQELAPEITDTLWARLHNPAEPVHGMVATDDGDLRGFVHCVFHRNTWGNADVCYLEDLFVCPNARGQGIGRKLIKAVYAKAKSADITRVYWVTDETNTTARKLYDQLASLTRIVQYRIDLS